MRFLFVFFVVMPILEMVVLIKVGGVIGVLPTIGLVLLTATIGVALLRQQGLSTLARAQDKMRVGQLPASEMVEGLFLAVGGALLLTPGFITDAIGFACLIPGIRQLLFKAASKCFSPNVAFYSHGHANWQSSSHRADGQGAFYNVKDDQNNNLKNRPDNSASNSPDNSASKSQKGKNANTTLDGEFKRED